ncbi:MAG: Lipase [Verrucomicrobiales bacterium]|nr:Lipase [Verrucomicrobiales bacterium]
MKSFCGALVLLVSGMVIGAAEPVGEAFVYKKIGDREMKLYVSKPADWKSSDQRPALVFFHGGGWVGGAPSQFNDQCQYFASRGLVTATVDYRLMSHEKTATPVECIQDAKSAMRWVRSHAKELGIDPTRIGAGGGSAGGHLAAFVGMVEGKDDPKDDLSVSPKPKALVLFNPVFNNGPDQYAYSRVGEHYKEFSPAHNITRDDPPTVVFLGSNDHLIPVQTAHDFETEMKKVGVRCDVHIYEGQKHGFYGKANPKYYYETVLEADKFLASLGWIKGQPTVEMPAPRAKAEKK